jgi:hypothetical protein
VGVDIFDLKVIEGAVRENGYEYEEENDSTNEVLFPTF